MAHPAKFSKDLIFRIIQHAIEEGFVSAGQTVFDPFAGVALGSLPCNLQGIHWLGIELEPRFAVELGPANLELWRQRYAQVAGYGTAVLLQGDSRQLTALLREQADCCVASPPFCDSDGRKGGSDLLVRHLLQGGRNPNAPHMASLKTHTPYGDSPQNLGNLPTGALPAALAPVPQIDAALASPPYADGCTHTGGADPQPQHVQGGDVRHVVYGHTPGQLADAAVASPPWENSVANGHLAPEQLADMRSRGHMPSASGQAAVYGEADGQLGQTQGTTFWEASRVILEQVFQVLKPGGYCIWVTKRYVRDGQIVDFTGDWAKLNMAVGFEWLHHHKAMLVEEHGTQENLFSSDDGPDLHYTDPEGDDFSHPLKTTGRYTTTQSTDKQRTKRVSFFRRLHEKKRPDLAIDFEDVLCFRRPLADPLPPDEAWQQMDLCASSPPYAGAGEVLGTHNGIDWTKTTGTGQRLTPGREMATYGHSPGQLGAMPEGPKP